MKKELTASGVEAMKPRATRYQVFDLKTGLCLRITPTGAKSWGMCYRWHGRSTRLKLGDYPAVTLAEARKKWKDADYDLEHGIDPAAEKKADAGALTVDGLRTLYLEKHASKKRSGDEDRRILNKYIPAHLQHRAAAGVERWELRKLITDIAAHGLDGTKPAPIMANRTLACIRKMYAWGMSQDLEDRAGRLIDLEISPVLGIDAPGEEKSRDRVLTIDEIKRQWQACVNHPASGSDIFRLELVTGQRGQELRRMRFDKIHEDAAGHTYCDVSGDDAKNEKAYRFYLSRPALEIVQAAARRNAKRTKRQGGPSPWVFPGRRKGQPITETKNILADVREAAGIEAHWNPHDLRRTCVTYMAEIGIEESIISRILNHTVQAANVARVTAVYQRYPFEKEKREALDKWASRLMMIVSDLHEVKSAGN